MLKISKNKNGKYFVSLRGRNGRKLMTSEAYASKGNAKRAMEDIEETMTGIFQWRSRRNLGLK